MHMEIFPGSAIPECLSKILGKVRHIKFANTVVCTLKQPNFVLAESQNKVPSVAAEEGKKRFDVETVGNNHQFLKNKRKEVVAKHFCRKKHCKSVALVLMEKISLQKFLGRFQQLLCLGSGKTLCNQALLGLTKQILKSNRILLGFWSRAVHWHKN